VVVVEGLVTGGGVVGVVGEGMGGGMVLVMVVAVVLVKVMIGVCIAAVMVTRTCWICIGRAGDIQTFVRMLCM
jgi:hypothetical protein